MRGLKGKRVVITGGASGIGAATAARFLAEGSLVAVLDRDPAACKKIRAQQPGIAGTFLADVADHGQVQRAFAAIVRELGGLDVVINNAGISIRHKFLDITPDEWGRVLAVNLTGVFYVAQTAARYMARYWPRSPPIFSASLHIPSMAFGRSTSRKLASSASRLTGFALAPPGLRTNI